MTQSHWHMTWCRNGSGKVDLICILRAAKREPSQIRVFHETIPILPQTILLLRQFTFVCSCHCQLHTVINNKGSGLFGLLGCWNPKNNYFSFFNSVARSLVADRPTSHEPRSKFFSFLGQVRQGDSGKDNKFMKKLEDESSKLGHHSHWMALVC